jgi:hypothetical protein
MKTQTHALVRFIKNIFCLLIVLSALSVTGLAQPGRLGKVMAQVDMGGGGGGGISSVTFELYRAQSGCCDECKKPPERPCRKCGCVIAANLVGSRTFKTDGRQEVKDLLEFKDLPPGRYLFVNDAGLEKFVEVKGDAKIDLGTVVVDDGRPFKPPASHRLPPVP